MLYFTIYLHLFFYIYPTFIILYLKLSILSYISILYVEQFFDEQLLVVIIHFNHYFILLKSAVIKKVIILSF